MTSAWVSNSEWIPSLECFVTCMEWMPPLAQCLLTSRQPVWQPNYLYPHTCIQALVKLESVIELAAALQYVT